MLEARIEEFQKTVDSLMEDFYLTILTQEDARQYFLENIFNFYGKMTGQAIPLIRKYEDEFTREELSALTDRLQRIEEGALDIINTRLGRPVKIDSQG